MLKLMYITNDPKVAEIADECGVDRIFVDMEYLGKEERQPGDTVKSHHTVEDVRTVRSVIKNAELLVRVNPISDPCDGFVGSEAEIDAVIEAGADIVMLPMARTVGEVSRFIRAVGGRARTMLLLETAEAAQSIEEILTLAPTDEVHIGLNDLHLSYKMSFMFELLADGTVERLCRVIASHGKPYGFGGIARIGLGMLPSERVITEHYRLGSGAAILSRSFCNIQNLTSLSEIRQIFTEGVRNIRDFEAYAAGLDEKSFEENRALVAQLVARISEEGRRSNGK